MNKVAVDPVGSADTFEPTQSSPAVAAIPATPVTVPKTPFRLTLSLMMDRLRVVSDNVLPTIVMVALLLGIWQIACSQPGASLPPPLKVFADTQELIWHPFFEGSGTDKGLGWQLLASLERVAIGFSLAAVVGVALGVLLGQSKFAFRAFDPIFQVLRMVPPLAWLPISLAAFQKANPSAIFVIFITAIWPILLNTVVGVNNIPQNYRNIARVLQLSGPEYFFKIMLPATVPYMFTGLRIGIGMSWIAIIAAETLIGGVGIGFFIWDAWNSSLLSEIIIALVYVGLVGFVLDRLIASAGRLIARTSDARS